MQLVRPPKPNALAALFSEQKPVIGTVHLHSLPGSPAYQGESLDSVLELAMRDAEAYKAGGADGLIVENSGDLPFSKPEDIGPETVAFLTRATTAIVSASGMPVGVNCLANAVIPALAVAAASGAQFVRSNQWVNAYVANEGFVEGASSKALRFRRSISATHVQIFADVHVKHGSHSIVADRSVADQARDADFFDADVLIATGVRTGHSTSLEEVEAIREGSALPLIVGSGLSVDNVAALFQGADGAIVGSSLKEDGAWWNPVQRSRVERLMEKVDQLRRDLSHL